jgi:hypothetical protein
MNWLIDELTLSSWREDSKLLKKQASWPSVPMTTVKLMKGRSAQAAEMITSIAGATMISISTAQS